ncbi:MAG: hypothetical protein JWM19_779 [Actinomycetia bacterium]|nr:hypothetical protein [Actinomycetes bacterium]
MRASRRLLGACGAVAVLGLGLGLWSSSGAQAAPKEPAAAARPAVIPKCTAGSLAVWINVARLNGAAGTFYYPLEFTNVSAHECYMYGYPGVSAIGANGRQLGRPATRKPATSRVVNVAPGATVHATLAYHDVAASTTPSCRAVPAALIRAYPPDQTAYTQGFDSLPSCQGSVVYMAIGVIQPGL